MHFFEIQRKELDEKRNTTIAKWGLAIAVISIMVPVLLELF